MSLDIGDALSEGLDRTFAPNGLLLLAVIVGFKLVNAVVQQSYSRVQYERFDLGEALSEVRGLPIDPARLQEFLRQATPLAYLDGLPLSVLFLSTVVLAFVAEATRIVAVRTFVSEETETIPRDLVRRNVAWATFNGVVGGVVVGVLVILGLLFFVVPGLFLLVSFFFVRQEIAIEDENFVDAMANSWELTKGNRIKLFGLALILFVATFGVSLVAGIFEVFGPTVGSITNVVATAVVLVFSVAVVARAYDQLTTERAEAEDEDGIEQYMDEDLDPI